MAKGKQGKQAKKADRQRKSAEEEPQEVFADSSFEEGIEKRRRAEKRSNFYFFLTVGVVTIVLVGIIIAGVYLRHLNQEKDSYNNFKFVHDGRFWTTAVEYNGILVTVPFYYHPTELESIDAERGIENRLLNFSRDGTIFITLDPDLNTTIVQAGVQVARLTGERFNILNIPTYSAITNLPSDFQVPENFTGNLTLNSSIITCADANQSIMVVWLKLGPDDRLFSEGNCIILQGYNEVEVLKVAELLDYKILKIM